MHIWEEYKEHNCSSLWENEFALRGKWLEPGCRLDHLLTFTGLQYLLMLSRDNVPEVSLGLLSTKVEHTTKAGSFNKAELWQSKMYFNPPFSWL